MGTSHSYYSTSSQENTKAEPSIEDPADDTAIRYGDRIAHLRFPILRADFYSSAKLPLAVTHSSALALLEPEFLHECKRCKTDQGWSRLLKKLHRRFHATNTIT